MLVLDFLKAGDLQGLERSLLRHAHSGVRLAALETLTLLVEPAPDAANSVHEKWRRYVGGGR